MSLPQMIERLDELFHLLAGMRIGGGRQQTLLTTVRWSHDLFDEKLLWARLTVFPGSFDLAGSRVGVRRDAGRPGGSGHPQRARGEVDRHL
ncbi:hypothetical protein ACIBF1_32815 [Spirillospora sp. NPDC050679]